MRALEVSSRCCRKWWKWLSKCHTSLQVSSEAVSKNNTSWAFGSLRWPSFFMKLKTSATWHLPDFTPPSLSQVFAFIFLSLFFPIKAKIWQVKSCRSLKTSPFIFVPLLWCIFLNIYGPWLTVISSTVLVRRIFLCNCPIPALKGVTKQLLGSSRWRVVQWKRKTSHV